MLKKLPIKALMLIVVMLCSLSGMAATKMVKLYTATAAAVGGVATNAEHFTGLGAWYNNQSATEGKMELYLPTSLLGTFTIDDIAKLSFSTKKVSGEPINVDFYMSIYTVGTDHGWYGERLTSEPMYYNDFNAPYNAWTTYTTNVGSNQMTFFDSNHSPAGYSGAPTLTDLQAGGIDWSSSSPYWSAGSFYDYGAATVKYISMGTGSCCNANMISYLDDIEITLKNGDVLIVDLENEPPATTISDPVASNSGCGFFEVPVTVRDFSDVGAISMVLNYNKDVLGYDGIGLNTLISGASVNTGTAGQIRLSYFGLPVTLEQDAVLFTLRFKMLTPATGNTDLTWSTVKGDNEFAGPNGDPVFAGTFTDKVLTLPTRPVRNTNTNREFCTIQAAIDDALTVTGNTLTVASGNYAEHVVINKGVTLKGANAGTSCTGTRVDESVISVSSGAAVTIASEGVTIDGFEITNPGGFNAVSDNGYGTLAIRNNKIHDIGTSAIGGAVHAIAVAMNSTLDIAGVTIEYNCLSGIGNVTNTYSGSGIGVGWSSAAHNISGLLIQYNSISGVFANPANKGAYGIIVNVGSGSSANGKAISPVISYNSISGLDGFWAHGIGLEGETPGALVTNNLIDDLKDYKTPSDAVGVLVEENDGAATVAINHNSFTNMGYGIQNKMTATVDGTCNWWGSTGPIPPLVAGNVTWKPFLDAGGSSISSGPGFEPTGTCVNCIEMTLGELHTNLTCFGGADGSINLTVSGIAPFSFAWSGPFDFSATTEDLSNLKAGNYSVTVTDGNLCTKSLAVELVVTDAQDPVITICPPAVEINGCTTEAITSPVYSETLVVVSEEVFEAAGGEATDNCSITWYGYQDVSTGTCPIVVTRTWTVKDGMGNDATCTQNIQVVHQTPPAEVGGPVLSAGTVECTSSALEPQNLPVVKDMCGTVLTPSTPFKQLAFTMPFDIAVALSSIEADNSWYSDRYDPAGFASQVLFEGENRLKESLSSTDGSASRPSAFVGSFYNTQGRSYNFGEATDYAEIKLYIPSEWATTNKRMAGFWGVAVDGSDAVSGYPIVEFTSDNNSPRFRVWESGGDGGWVDLGLPAGFVYNTWVTLKIRVMPSGEFLLSAGSMSYLTKTSSPDASVRLKSVILQGYNYSPQDITIGVTYDIYWDDLTWNDTYKEVCEGLVTWTYSYSDCSGLPFAWVYTYLIKHVTPPSLPNDGASTVQCLSAATTPEPPVVNDVCGNPIEPVLVSTVDNPNPLLCEGTRTYNYSYKDCAGLESNWKYVYTVTHLTPPVVPANVNQTISCPAEAVEPRLLTSVLDQQQTQIAANPNWLEFTSIGQSFTCGKSGLLTSIQLQVGSINQVLGFMLKIFEGNGIAGTLLYEGDQSLSATGWQTLNIGQDVAPYLTAGKQYTFWLTEFSFKQLGLLCMTPSAYAGGVGMDGCISGCDPTYTWQQWPAYDLVFKTYMSVMPMVQDVCGTVIEVSEPVVSGTYTTNGCEGTIVYTYTYEDCAGLKSDWVYTYTIERQDFTMPANQGSTVECISAAVAPTPPTVYDNCGNQITPTGPVSGGTFDDCEGTYTYTWTYTDCEGNTHPWVYTYTIDDNTAPSITAPGTVSVQTTDGCTATNVSLGTPIVSDNCGGEVTVTNNAPVAFPLGSTTVTWTAKDCAGNSNTATQTVTVTAHTLSGRILYYDQSLTQLGSGTPVKLTLKQGETVIQEQTTSTGTYSFTDLCSGLYQVVVSTTRTETGGINSTDAAQVNFWGVSSYPVQVTRFLAGDVNGDLSILSNDAGLIQQFFLTAGSSGFARSPWTFWKADESISANPGPSTQIVIVGSTDLTQDFYALVTGDFNGSFAGTKSAAPTLFLKQGEERLVSNDKLFELPVISESDMEVGALSLVLNVPADQVSVEGVSLGDNVAIPVRYSIFGNELRISWYSIEPMTVKAGGNLVTLELKPKGDGDKDIRVELASNPLNELANRDYDVMPDVRLQIGAVKATSLPIDMAPKPDDLKFSNFPNPFSGQTTFSYRLPVGGKVILEIRDILGRKVRELVNEPQPAGIHALPVDGRWMTSGVYFATIRLVGQDQVERMQTIKIVSTK